MITRAMALTLLSIGLVLAGCCADRRGSEKETLVWGIGGAEIRGLVASNGVAEFRGIAYAKPPVGDLRWRAPQQLPPSVGEIDATRFGSACPQGQGNPDWYRTVAKGLDADPELIADLDDISEDCLYLNVWSNGAGGTPKPVMVWIHGGSNVNGFSHEPNYLGHRLAARDIVFVSLNYRLGALGFLPHPLLDEEDPNAVSGYYGLADQVAALQWIQSNIAAFGGAPDNVTIFGESAGGGNIAALLRMRSASGLFHRAAIQSGALAPYDAVDYEAATKAGEKLFDTLEAKTLEQMRATPWEELVDQTPIVLPDYYFGPVADGRQLEGREITSPVPLLIGVNADEMLMYMPQGELRPFESALSTYGGEQRDAVAAYFAQGESGALAQANRLASASEFFCPALGLARQVAREGVPVFYYYFTRIRPDGEELGAYHGAEIPYVFDTADEWLPSSETDRELTQMMVSYWTNFARSGDPNGSELPQWQPFDPSAGTVHELGISVGATSDHPARACSLLSTSS
ncbi:MAG: carboxylesterase family protein [Erythrobacter sp.]